MLDNFEHLLTGVDLIIRVLQQTTKVTLLITSRERLALQAEQVFELDGLSYPGSDENVPIEQSGAVQLFIERAQQVQRKFQLDARSRRDRAHLPLSRGAAPRDRVGRLNGQPAVVRRPSPTDIASSLRTLVTKYRDLPERHRSMWAAFEHSWHVAECC